MLANDPRIKQRLRRRVVHKSLRMSGSILADLRWPTSEAVPDPGKVTRQGYLELGYFSPRLRAKLAADNLDPRIVYIMRNAFRKRRLKAKLRRLKVRAEKGPAAIQRTRSGATELEATSGP